MNESDIERLIVIVDDAKRYIADLLAAINEHMAEHNRHVARHDADDTGMKLIVSQMEEFQEFLLRHPREHAVHLAAHREEHAVHRARHAVDDEFGTPLISVHKPTEWGG